MRGTTDDARSAVAVEVVGVHVGAGFAQFGRMEFPWLIANLGRLFPPTVGDDHIKSAVAIDVADAEAVGEPECARDDVAGARDWFSVLHFWRRARRADGMHAPMGVGIGGIGI